LQIQDIPRAYLRTTLRALRVPIELSEAVANRSDGGRPWPPAVAFEAFEGGIKRAVGSLIRDERLIEEGELNQAAAKEHRQALLLGAVAETRRERAEERFEAKQDRVTQAREATIEKAENQKRAAERAAAEKKSDLAAKAQTLAEQDARFEAAAQESVERKDRTTRSRQIQNERQAIAAERRAVATEAAVAELEAEIEKSKKARKSD
jgi:hypothetical protein